jgi:hypothetical protein
MRTAHAGWLRWTIRRGPTCASGECILVIGPHHAGRSRFRGSFPTRWVSCATPFPPRMTRHNRSVPTLPLASPSALGGELLDRHVEGRAHATPDPASIRARPVNLDSDWLKLN